MSAGASFHTGIASGKFQGVISADDPERAADGVEALEGHRGRVDLADRPPRLPGGEAEDRRAAGRLEARLPERLPHLGGHVARNLLDAGLERVGGLGQERASRRRREAAQAGAAAAAASTAAAASSAPDAWKTPVTSSGRHGFRFSYVSSLAASRHSPPT